MYADNRLWLDISKSSHFLLFFKPPSYVQRSEVCIPRNREPKQKNSNSRLYNDCYKNKAEIKKVTPKTTVMLKIYEDIINEVISRLEEDGDSVNISRSTIYELRNDWREKLTEYTQSEWVNDSMGNRELYIQRYPGYGGLRGRTRNFLAKENPMERDPGVPREREDEYVSEMTSSDEDLELIEDSTGNYMICLYVKVNKSKNKWKCVFKQGFINIGNIDFAFNSAQGELEW